MSINTAEFFISLRVFWENMESPLHPKHSICFEGPVLATEESSRSQLNQLLFWQETLTVCPLAPPFKIVLL